MTLGVGVHHQITAPSHDRLATYWVNEGANIADMLQEWGSQSRGVSRDKRIKRGFCNIRGSEYLWYAYDRYSGPYILKTEWTLS